MILYCFKKHNLLKYYSKQPTKMPSSGRSQRRLRAARRRRASKQRYTWAVMTTETNPEQTLDCDHVEPVTVYWLKRKGCAPINFFGFAVEENITPRGMLETFVAFLNKRNKPVCNAFIVQICTVIFGLVDFKVSQENPSEKDTYEADEAIEITARNEMDLPENKPLKQLWLDFVALMDEDSLLRVFEDNPLDRLTQDQQDELFWQEKLARKVFAEAAAEAAAKFGL
jgi:hypothetical protein